MYLYFSTVYDSHPWRPDLVRRSMCKVIEVRMYSGTVERLVQFNSWTSEGAITTDLVQCVSVSRLVSSISWLIECLHMLTL